MTEPPQPSRFELTDIVSIGLRWLLGILFVYMGLKKALDPVTFLKLIRQYEMVSTPWILNSIASTLPWFETFCGLLLIAGIGVRGAAVNLLAMLVPFTIIVLRRALAISSAKALAFCAVKFDCGCGMGEVFICNKLAENSGLILVCCWLLLGKGRKFALRYGLAD